MGYIQVLMKVVHCVWKNFEIASGFSMTYKLCNVASIKLFEFADMKINIQYIIIQVSTDE